MSSHSFGRLLIPFALLVGCGDNIHRGNGKVMVTPTSGLTTTEAGGEATFSLVLDTTPYWDVTVQLASSDSDEGTASPATLTFTTANWDAPQIVTVTGVQDEIADGNQTYMIVVEPAASKDRNFDGKDVDDVAVDNIDDDTAGVRVTPTSGLMTTESGGSATFSVVLNTKPTADVAIDLTSSNDGEGVASPASLTFTADNWNAPQTVTVTGVNDEIDDGAQTYTIVTAGATSTDARYAGLDADDVALSNTDNDTAGITVTPTTGLVTTEAGGKASFSVVLSSQPVADVTVALASDDPSEGTPDSATVTFTPANWNAPQTVMVTGADDAIADGGQVYVVATEPASSTDAGYSGIDGDDVSLTNTDNDSAGVTLSKTSGLVTTESGGEDTFTIVLNSQPTANVTIPLSSNNTGEGTVSLANVTFTPANWNAPQLVRLTGVDDAVADGGQPYSVITAPATSADSGYNNFDAPNAGATNTDNDSAGFIVTPTTGRVTTESGGQTTFTIVLTSQPTANVTIPLTSSDTGEGTVSPASVTFTSANWNAPRTVTVTGVNDDVADGSQIYTIVTDAAVSADTGYGGGNAPDVPVTNTDNDSAGITVSKTTITTTESGGQDTFTIVLNSQPTANVSIAVSSSDTTEGAVSPTTLTFTTTNWNAPQTVTVTGVNDFVADGGQLYTVVTAAATSADTSYQGRNAADVDATNLDNDSARIVVAPTSGLTTKENGDTATFTIVLASQPTSSVTIALSSSDTTEGTVLPASVTFTTVNWNAPQTVTVKGVDDAGADGNQIYSVDTAAATSTDGNYSGLDADDVTLTNLDNDTAGILVSPTTGLTVHENGASATFAIQLQSQPTQDVTVTLSSNDPSEGTVAPGSVTFTPLNWNAAQLVTVTGVDDAIFDSGQVFLVVTGAALSADAAYNGIDPPDVTVTNIDNDSPGIRVTPTSGLTTSETAPGTATFDVVLESQPTSNVTITLSSNDTSEGTIAQTSLTFTPVNWNSAQTVTITGVDDNSADGNQPYTIIIGPASSTDAGYNGIDPPNVAVSNTDNDTAGVVVTPVSGLTTTETAGGSAFFTMVLTSQPSADVTITLASSNPAEGTLPITTVTFTTTDWNIAKTVTVTGVDDSISDGNQLYTVVTSATSSTDLTFDGLLVADVSVTNIDNDIAGVTLDPFTGLLTSEFGDFDTFTIVLNSPPTADVTIGLSISDPTEATLGLVTSVTFTPLDWNVPQTVTVTGLDDLLADSNQPFLVVTAPAVSADPNYNGMNAPDIDGSNFDNDTPGVYIKARRLLRTGESGQNTFFRISLTTQPTSNVTCTFSSSNPAEGTVGTTSVTFTPANFNLLQTVTVIGVDDAVKDGDQLYTIVSAACTSGDGTYNGIDPRDVTVLNRDND